MKTVEMDIRGQVCPSSLLLVLREVNEYHQQIARGDLRLLVMIDNRDATGTIPMAVSNMGFDAAVEKRDGYYTIAISQHNGETD